MKKMMFTLIALLAIAASASAMTYDQARREALFLTDKMAYELNLSDAQYEAAYEINLDYLMGVSSRDNVFGSYWERRNLDLSYILYSWQWDLFRAATYFYRPLYWEAGYWHFGIYARYPHRDYFYFGRPHFYATYRGGHSWRMNGGRSFYEHHRDHFRPEVHRDRYVGMRDGWNRGDYRSGARENSSTRVTGRDNNWRNGGQNDNRNNRSGDTYRPGNSRNGGTQSDGYRPGNNNSNRSDSYRPGSVGSSRQDASRPSGGSIGRQTGASRPSVTSSSSRSSMQSSGMVRSSGSSVGARTSVRSSQSTTSSSAHGARGGGRIGGAVRR